MRTLSLFGCNSIHGCTFQLSPLCFFPRFVLLLKSIWLHNEYPVQHKIPDHVWKEIGKACGSARRREILDLPNTIDTISPSHSNLLAQMAVKVTATVYMAYRRAFDSYDENADIDTVFGVHATLKDANRAAENAVREARLGYDFLNEGKISDVSYRQGGIAMLYMKSCR